MNNAKVFLDGNLTRDPEVRDVKGSPVTVFTVAVTTNVKNDDGTYKSDFYDVSVWGRLGEYIPQRLQKGSRVWVTGGLTTNEYVGRDNEKHLGLRVTADDVRGIARLKGEERTVQTRPVAEKPKTRSYSSMDNDMPF